MFEAILKIGSYPYLDKHRAFLQKLSSVFKMYWLVIFAIIAIAPVLILTDKFVTGVLHHKSLNDVNKHMFDLFHHKAGFLKSLLIICLVGPTFEELMFRFPLSFTKRQVTISLVIAFFYFGGAFYHTRDILVKPAIEIAIALVVFALGYRLVPNTPLNISDKLKKQLIILSIILFGLMHILNYKPIEWPLIWIYPIYVIPQVLMGWGITYVRFRNGFAWGIALHALINTVSTLLTFLFMK